MKNQILNTRAEHFFSKVTTYPKTLLTLGIFAILLAVSFIPQLTKDTRTEAFIPTDHPAVVYRDKVEEIFGLKDPMVISVMNDDPEGVFNPHSLNLVRWLTDRVSEIPGIDPERITSLATEDDIIGTEEGMLIEPFYEDEIANQEEATKVRGAVMDFPLYLGSLVARDGNATLIVAELLDESRAQEIYESLLKLVSEAPANGGETIHVAGEGAVAGYLGSYIDADAQRLNPVAAIVISLILFFAYRTMRGVMLPNFIVLGTVGISLGVMAAMDIPFYIITNALPVVLIGIAVADSIHILAQYYEEMAQHPDSTQQALIVRAMTQMWRPVTITTLTTIAGFMGIYFASFMPPMKAFGLFAALGVASAYLFTMIVLPAGLALLKPLPSPVFLIRTGHEKPSSDRYSRFMTKAGRWVATHPTTVLISTALVIVISVIGALQLEVNESRIDNFQTKEVIYLADQAINESLDGTAYLDVVIETPKAEGLLIPANLRRIEALQRYLETLPHVKGTTSIVDYLKQMNRAMHEDQPETYVLPEDADLLAQYFLLYSASGDPSDFEEEIDYDYRLANVRATMDTGRYSDEKIVVEAAQHYIQNTFNVPGITAKLSGRVNIDYHWISSLTESHFRGIVLALIAVWLMAALTFRSALAGLLALVPVGMAILIIYAVMGFSGIWLGVGTSMFAAIAIGVGVDFSIHTIDRLISLVKEDELPLTEAFVQLFPSTGRAMLFNFFAVFFGFGVLATSQVPPLARFGSLVGVAVSVSFLASMTVLPALIKVLQPGFLKPKNKVVEVEIMPETSYEFK